MKLILKSRSLIALTTISLLTLSACSPHSTDTPTTASVPVANTPASASATPSRAASNEHSEEANENGAPSEQAPTSSSASAAERGPRVKNIALGDSPDTVRQAVTALFPPSSTCLVSDDAVRVVCENTAQRLQGSFTYESGRLSSFKFYPYLTSLAFGQMPFDDFTRNFMKAYGIPRMDPAQDNPALSQYLRYRDNGGWEVSIYPDNTFYVKSVATASQQAKSFN